MLNSIEAFSPDGRHLVEFLNTVLRAEVEIWGDPVDAILLRTIHLGEEEQRLYDVTSLATVTAMTVPTTARRVSDLINRGMIIRHRDGRSFRLALSEDCRQRLSGSLDTWCVRARQMLADDDDPPVPLRSETQ